MRLEDDPVLRKYPEFLEQMREPKRPTDLATLLAKLRETLAGRESSPPSSTEPEKKPGCPDCHDKGFHPVLPGDLTGPHEVCHCMDERRHKAVSARLWAEANFPDDIEKQALEGMDMAHPDTVDMVGAAKDYIKEQEPPILAFLGSNGNGKTRVALAAARAILLNEEMPVYFAYLPVFLKALQGGQFTGRGYQGQDHFELYARATAKGLVILDDLGLYKATEWADVQFDGIMGWRYLMGYPTIVTANVALGELPVRMQSRLSDPAKCRVVVVEAPDMRAKNEPRTRKGQWP